VRTAESGGYYQASWSADRDASLEVIIEDLVPLLVASELDRLNGRGTLSGIEDERIAREICAGHSWTRSDYEVDALLELVRARASTLARHRGFQLLVEQLVDPLLEAGELDGEQVRTILEGDTDAT
jgi:hypothetical protein